MTQEDQNLQSLFANLNQVSRNSMIREKVGGGTGGGSNIAEGTMDPNTLMTGNPYIAKNVVEFNQGGMVGASGAPTMNNPYIEKMNQLVGLQQMVNVGKGLANNVLQQEAMMSAPKAAYGMKRKYFGGGSFSPFQTTSGEGTYVGHKPGSSAYKAYVKQGVIPTGETDFNTHTGQYTRRSAMKRYTNGGRF